MKLVQFAVFQYIYHISSITIDFWRWVHGKKENYISAEWQTDFFSTEKQNSVTEQTDFSGRAQAIAYNNMFDSRSHWTKADLFPAHCSIVKWVHWYLRMRTFTYKCAICVTPILSTSTVFHKSLLWVHLWYNVWIAIKKYE